MFLKSIKIENKCIKLNGPEVCIRVVDRFLRTKVFRFVFFLKTIVSEKNDVSQRTNHARFEL